MAPAHRLTDPSVPSSPGASASPSKTLIVCLASGLFLLIVLALFVSLIRKSRRLKRQSKTEATLKALARYQLVSEAIRREQQREPGSHYIFLPLKHASNRPAPPPACSSTPQNTDHRQAHQHVSSHSFDITSINAINHHPITLGREIGRGQFSSVFHGWSTQISRSEKVEVALKILHPQGESDDRVALAREARILSKLRHRNIVSSLGLGTATHGSRVVTCLCMEFMERGDLHTLLLAMGRNGSVSNGDCHASANVKPEVELLLSFSRDIASGMNFLSSHGYVHRDLAARNCLVNRSLVVKISDFGLACQNVEAHFLGGGLRRFPARWMAIESLMHGEFSHKTDVWSFGVTLWEIFSCGAKPYADIPTGDICSHLSEEKRLPQPNACPDHVYEIMLSCWSTQPCHRPSFHRLAALI